MADVEGELIEDINGKYLWRMADGREVAVENMADNHLRNCSLFLMGMGYLKCHAAPIQCIAWLTVFRREWERRMLARMFQKDWDRHNKAYDDQKELDDDINERKQLR